MNPTDSSPLDLHPLRCSHLVRWIPFAPWRPTSFPRLVCDCHALPSFGVAVVAPHIFKFFTCIPARERKSIAAPAFAVLFASSSRGGTAGFHFSEANTCLLVETFPRAEISSFRVTCARASKFALRCRMLVFKGASCRTRSLRGIDECLVQ